MVGKGEGEEPEKIEAEPAFKILNGRPNAQLALLSITPVVSYYAFVISLTRKGGRRRVASRRVAVHPSREGDFWLHDGRKMMHSRELGGITEVCQWIFKRSVRSGRMLL